MARIRSVHPGIFTDEQFASLSDGAQVFYFGLLTEADDQGIFEWKPATLRMRLRPCKDGGVESLLAELESAEKIAPYEINGRKYGAIRNFRKFQRPKSPNALHPTTPQWRIYVGLEEPSAEMERDEVPPFPPNGEKSPQMEDGGGRMDGGEGEEERAFACFALAATRRKWPTPRKLDADRRKKLRARLDEHGLDGWQSMLDRAEASEFINKKFPLKLDWILEPKNFRKVIEGNYDAPGGGAPGDSPPRFN